METVIVITKPSPYSGIPLYLTCKGFWSSKIDDSVRTFTMQNEECARFYASSYHAGVKVIQSC